MTENPTENNVQRVSDVENVESNAVETGEITSTTVAKVEGFLERLGKAIKNGKTISLFALGILGLVGYSAWEIKGKEWAESFIRSTISTSSTENRKIVLDALFEINALEIEKRMEEIEGDTNTNQVRIASNSLAEILSKDVSALKVGLSDLEIDMANQASLFSSTIDSWQSFEFYRYFPSKKNEEEQWVADIAKPAVSKLEHDIIASPNDHLRLYFFAERRSAGGYRSINRQAMRGLKVGSKDLHFSRVKYEGEDIPLFCYTKLAANSAEGFGGIMSTGISPTSPRLVRLGIILEEANLDVEFRYKIFVVSTKTKPSENDCKAI